MPITKAISSKTNTKQLTNADTPSNPNQVVTATYGPVTSTAGQTVINMSFAVATANTANFFLIVDGKTLSIGASNDYTFTSISANGTSSQVTLNQALPAGLNIQAFYLGVVIPTFSLSTLTASVNALILSAKNQLINGNFDLWQRNTTNTIANGVSTYVADRWYVKNSLGTSGVITNSQVTGVTAGSLWGNKVQITTAPTAAQTNGTEIYQVIENLNTLPLLNKTLCFSAQIKALGNVATVGMQFMYATSEVKPTLTLSSEQSVAVNTSTFTLGSLLNQAVNTTPTSAGVVGVRIRILTVSTGNTYDLNNGFVVEQAMVNVGSSAANFERAGRNFSDELLMCQRYYEKSYNLTTNPGTNVGLDSPGGNKWQISDMNSGTNAITLMISYRTTKRSNATAVSYSEDGTINTVRDRINSTNISVTITGLGQSGAQWSAISLSTASSQFLLEWQWTADAEI